MARFSGTASNPHRCQEAIAASRFREDLSFRINVANLELPPLGDRPEDINLPAGHFARKIRAKTGKAVRGIAPVALAALRRHPFLGNVRELEHAIAHAFVLCGSDEIGVAHLPSAILGPASGERSAAASPTVASERERIEPALQSNLGSRCRAAAESGMHRATLWRTMKSYGVG